MNEYYTNKVALVTGASSGIGREIVRELVGRGSSVVAVARRTNRLMELRESLGEQKERCIPIAGDLRRIEDVGAIVEQTYQRFGRVNILVNNAAVGSSKRFTDLDRAEIEAMYQTNLLGTTLLTHEVVKRMVTDGTGHVVFVTSLAGKLGFPNLAGYSATKFGLEGLAEALRYEVEGNGVNVTVLRPGVTGTEFFEVAGMEQFETDMKAKGKMGTPQQVAFELLDQLPEKPDDIVVGPDKWFLKIMPFIPRKYQFRVLNLFS